MSEPKAIILTGASRGIGLAVARYLLGEKHNLFLVARTKEPLEKLKKEFPGQVEFLSTDLADFEVSGGFLRLCSSSSKSMSIWDRVEWHSRIKLEVRFFLSVLNLQAKVSFRPSGPDIFAYTFRV